MVSRNHNDVDFSRIITSNLGLGHGDNVAPCGVIVGTRRQSGEDSPDNQSANGSELWAKFLQTANGSAAHFRETNIIGMRSAKTGVYRVAYRRFPSQSMELMITPCS